MNCPRGAQLVPDHWTLAFDAEQAQRWIDNELVCALTQDEVTDLINQSEGNHEETDEASGDS